MSEMNSFYGGRKGDSFVIVKRFDGIDIPQVEGSYVYTGDYYAVDSNNNYRLDSNSNLIVRNVDNQNDYLWKWHENNGETAVGSVKFPEKKAQGMVQCFSQGAVSASEVNYNEYVIIDTISGMHQYQNIDNGKVYRRGFAYDGYLAGAEYICQIVGPKGETPEVEIATIAEVHELPLYHDDSYTIANGGLVPGYYLNGFNSATYLGTYQTDVYTELLNKVEFPSSVVLYKVTNGATLTYEYYTWDSNENTWNKQNGLYNDELKYSYGTSKDEAGNVTGVLLGFHTPYSVTDFVAVPVNAYYHRDEDGASISNKNLIERTDNGTHPYYQSWKINVPIGIKGDTITQLEKVNSVIVANTQYYYEETLATPAGILTEDTPLDITSLDFSLSYLKFKLNSVFYYIPNNNTTTKSTILRYKETNYNKNATGTYKYIKVADYNTIEKIDIANDGTIKITYSHDGEIELDNKISFIDLIQITSNGSVEYFYSKDHSTPAFTQTEVLKWIANVTLDGNSGNGSQRITVTLNDGTSTPIGDPLNYILEATISEARTESAETAPYHLLILYSDPARRAALPLSEKAKYRSSYPDAEGNYLRSDWHDLGNVRGAKGGFSTIANIEDKDWLKDDNNIDIPPEYMLYAVGKRRKSEPYVYTVGEGLDSAYCGWGVTYTEVFAEETKTKFYFYDYESKKWYDAGGVGGGSVEASQVVIISTSEETAENKLTEDGIWLELTPIKMAK